MSRVIFINLTKRCNVNCPRCYILESHRQGRDSFSPDMLRAALGSRFVQEADEPPLVIFQGGEPTLVGPGLLADVCAAVRESHPGIRMTMVSNLLATPPWFLDLAQREFGGRIETTWAAGRKMTLSGDEDRFQDAFARSLRELLSEGFICPVNVEMNPETLRAGPGAILDLHHRTGALQFEFDMSVSFDVFHANPSFGPGNAPVLPPSTTFSDVSSYLISLHRAVGQAGLLGSFRTQAFDAPAAIGADHSFNIGRELDFVTINPDGTVTTNPLFSDIPRTYLGSLVDADLDRILQNPDRQRRAIAERKRYMPCAPCPHVETCRGGSSHIPLFDAAGECAGLKSLLDHLA